MATVAQPFAPPVASAAGDRLHPRGLLRWVTTADHKEIGILYLLTSLVFGLIGGLEALLIRIQLAVPRNTFLVADQYNAVFTLHGTTMIFLVIMPLLLGFANYIVPLHIGARDMAYPRLNALSYWLFLFGGLLLYYSLLNGTPPDTGWFSNAPLTEHPYSGSPNPDYWALGLLVTSVGTIATGVNLFVTVFKLRAPGMTWLRLPVFTWMSLVTAVLILAAIPSLTAAQFMLLFDRYLGTHFFDPAGGGDPVLWQHLFWYFGHPEVYIMALPGFGIISEVVPVFSRKPIFGYPVIVASGVAIGFYSFLVWAHHMFAVGLGLAPDAFFGVASMVIAVPTGIKVFSWLGTLWGGRLRLTTAMLYALAFVVHFTLGGLSGVHFATVPVDWHTHDTYYVVAHFHYVLGPGTLFAILAGVYYWFPKISGRVLDERVGKLGFWLLLVGINLTFFPMHLLGLMGMQRRVWTYPDLPGWGALNFAETVGAFIQAVSVLVVLWNVASTLRRGRLAGDNPWNAWTLEWATTSPPPAYNFVALPPITSARPLYDLHHPAGVDGARGGRVDTPGQDQMALSGAARTPTPRPLSLLDRLHTPVLGILAFIFSEATFFGALIVAFVDFRLKASGAPGPHDLDVPRTLLFSLALFASSGTIVLAERALGRRDQAGFLRWWLATMVLGLVFLAGQVTEYQRLFAEGFTISRNAFTGAFYTLTGFHGFHVCVGLLALAIVGGLALRGDYRGGRRRTVVDTVSIYWHFVDGVWVAVLSVAYLWSLVG